MKILIITFSKGLNPGTFMQAFGVKCGLSRIFPEAIIEYLDFPNFKKRNRMAQAKNDSLSQYIMRKATATYRFEKYKHLRRTNNFIYSKPINLFDYDEQYATELLNSYDLIVVGSDTILEKAISNDEQRIGLNWCPIEYCETKHIMFAASASPANYSNDIDVLNKLAECVKRFSFLGLRDNLTINLFKEKLGVDSQKIIKQPDPTYLLDVEKFEMGTYYKSKLNGKKVALCNFSPNFPLGIDVGNTLRSKGYFVVSTSHSPYADLSIDTIDAFEWAGVFKLVDIVVTERFHDSVFALRNCKPVIAIDWEEDRYGENGDSKTYRILEEYDMSNLHFNISTTRMIEKISCTIDNFPELFNKSHVHSKNINIVTTAVDILGMIKDIGNGVILKS